MDEEKVRTFPLQGRKFSSTNQPSKDVRGFIAALRRSTHGVLDALGMEAELHRLATGTIEEKKIFWSLVRSFIPQEVTGEVDHSLTVRVVTQLGVETQMKLPGAREPEPVNG